MRFGHTTNGKVNATAPLSGQGLEVDKFSRDALDEFWSLYPAKLIELAGDHAGKTFKRFELDSYEMGAQDWTPKMADEFKNRRGYELFSWLPIIAGYTIESDDMTKRFKYDWQKTINDLFANNYYKYLEELIHKVPGMEFLCEPYGTGHGKNFDDSAIRGIGDILMAEFWTLPSTWGWGTLFPVSSNAHVNGKKIIAAEAFTGQPQYAFQTDLADLKVTGDLAFCQGINQYVLHASAHQPWPWLKPGMTMGWWGTQFGPSQTWWDNGASEWIDYVSRCQQILQKGLFVGDLCFLQLGGSKIPSIPSGYRADICNGKELMTRFSVADSKLTLPDGMSYKVLVIPDNCSVELALAKQIEKLVNEGAIVVGKGFVGSPGIDIDLTENEEVKSISKKIFGSGSTEKLINNIGKGKVFINYSPQEVLELENIEKDVEVLNDKKNIGWIHRNDGNEDYYFISNKSKSKSLYDISFRVKGMQPEIWNPVTGEVNNAFVWKMNGSRTIVSLDMEANESCFVVFRSKTAKKRGNIKSLFYNEKLQNLNKHVVQKGNKAKLKFTKQGHYKLKLNDGSIKEIEIEKNADTILVNNNWHIKFPKNLGAPESANFEKLISWTEHDNPGIKYFSGTAHYSNQFSLNKEQLNVNKQIVLNLGEVKNIASVTINNKKVRVLWNPPFTLDITKYCKLGDNKIEVDVTNLWPNRIIGDKAEPEDCEWGPMRDFPYVEPVPMIGRNLQKVPDWVKNKTERPSKNRITFCTVDFFNKETPLLASGILGPVQIIVEELIEFTEIK